MILEGLSGHRVRRASIGLVLGLLGLLCDEREVSAAENEGDVRASIHAGYGRTFPQAHDSPGWGFGGAVRWAVSPGNELGFEMEQLADVEEALYEHPDAPTVRVETTYAGIVWQHVSRDDALVRPYGNMGIGGMTRRRSLPGSGIDPPYPLEVHSKLRFAVAVGLGARFGRGWFKPTVEARMHLPVQGNIWGHIQAGVDFLQ